uniref:photosystem I reaction center subunit X n=1 Tax=Hypnea brasiliensis TaxID=1866962 RepID=UPI0023F40CCD|nr:photosystem I reaction center subunit X [Hypnea brasiliensis]WCH55288.1 photosystem I reaction center subunit X [Hypnea brasiliensis]WDY84737.1 photosystem I reaction center subunit X [Hypnea brasiliensis]
MNTILLLTIIPNTSAWSLQHAVIMIISNLICIGIGRYAIKIRGLGPEIPIVGLKEFGLPELLATTSLGHAIGAGAIIGLSSIGILT